MRLNWLSILRMCTIHGLFNQQVSTDSRTKKKKRFNTLSTLDLLKIVD